MYTIHLGYSGFPQGNAAIQRIRLTFKSLKAGGATPLIINKASINKTGSTKHVGQYDGIIYVNTSPHPSRPDSITKRNHNKLLGSISEFILLFKKRKEIDSAIFYGASFW